MELADRRRRWTTTGRHNDETTFAMIKSHVFATSNLSEIMGRIVDEGFVFVAARKLELSPQEINELYFEHRKQPYWPGLVTSVSGLVLPMVLMGRDAIRHWRDVLGDTNPIVARHGTLRAMFGSRLTPADNVAHGSDSRQSADREISIFFPAALNLRP